MSIPEELRQLSVSWRFALSGDSSSRRSRAARSNPCRRVFLLLLVVGAFVGALLGRFPFGPSTQDVLSKAGSSGGRDTLWLLPAFAVGLAAVLHRLRHLASSRPSVRSAFDGAVLVIALVVIARGYGEPPPYPVPGSASSTAYVEAHLRPGDVVILTQAYSFAAATHLPTALRATPDQQIGFVPVFEDGRVHAVGPWSGTSVTPAQIRSMVEGAHRVIQVSGLYEGRYGTNVGKVLEAAGFHARIVPFHYEVVGIWTR